MQLSALQFVQIWYTHPVPCARVVRSTIQVCTSIWSLRTPYLASPYGSCYETLGPRADYRCALEFNGRYTINTPYRVQVKPGTCIQSASAQNGRLTHMNTQYMYLARPRSLVWLTF